MIRWVPLAACLPVPINQRPSILPGQVVGCSALARADEPPVAPKNVSPQGLYRQENGIGLTPTARWLDAWRI